MSFIDVFFFLGAVLSAVAGDVSVVILYPLLSLNTSMTICPINSFNSLINCAASYSLRSIFRSLFSQMPVNFADLSKSILIVSIKAIPAAVQGARTSGVMRLLKRRSSKRDIRPDEGLLRAALLLSCTMLPPAVLSSGEREECNERRTWLRTDEAS